MNVAVKNTKNQSPQIEQKILELLEQMTLPEKIGQMTQRDASAGNPLQYLSDDIKGGRLGSILNNVDPSVISKLQKLAVDESRLGIPLLVGRDIIHGFATVMPIPLGQAATWNPDLVRDAAEASALEAARTGVNWTFAPMIDITRDPRWGRIAESLGEDVYLACQLAAAMVRGYQGANLAEDGRIAACAKHFAAYGAVESGRDYATTNVPENELRNVHLQPFKAAIDAGVATLMTSFSDLNGVPATANQFLLRQVLREEWQFDGAVVSDWDSVRQLQVHGLTENDSESAEAAAAAGVDMEMHGDAYSQHLEALVESGQIDMSRIDSAVARILRIKLRLGLFDGGGKQALSHPRDDEKALSISRQAALQSIVMLKNHDGVLPLSNDRLTSLAIIGPLADAPHEQMGTWVFDGDAKRVVTPLAAIRDMVGDNVQIHFEPAMHNSRGRVSHAFDNAARLARESDAALLFLGEESILSGEAHSRASIDLPGDQATLVGQIRDTGKPVIAVILAGRPLTLGNIVDKVDAILFAWHPGTMGGPAIADLLFGVASPSGKLPVTFPRVVGQIPIYYNHKHSGKPPTRETVVHIDDIEVGAPQTSLGMSAFHLDVDYTPMWEFGYGLSYAQFDYSNIHADKSELTLGDTLTISAELRNLGDMTADEVVQLYVRDLVGNVTRPVRELKGFRRVRLRPGQTTLVEFQLHTDDLAFYDRNMELVTEPGLFHAGIGGSSACDLRLAFRIVDNR